jgi:hypothetical protein
VRARGTGTLFAAVGGDFEEMRGRLSARRVNVEVLGEVAHSGGRV